MNCLKKSFLIVNNSEYFYKEKLRINSYRFKKIEIENYFLFEAFHN